MIKVKNVIVIVALSLFAIMASAQVSASFEERNGYQYAVITNYGSTRVYVKWRCVNYQLGQYRDGSIYLDGGYETCVGPNVGWNWQPGEEFIYQVSGGNSYNISFKGSHYVHLYDDNNKDQGSYLYYSDIQKIHIGGNSYKVIPSSKRGYKYQVQGNKLYFNY